MDAVQEIHGFPVGETDIASFRNVYDTHEETNAFLQGIADRHIQAETPCNYRWDTPNFKGLFANRS